MLFHITEHFFNPHSASVELHSHTQIGQIGSQTPKFFFSDFPMNQQV
jgi:hypothetical protein